MKHTPGPWTAEAWNCHAATTVRAGDVTIAECSGHGRYSSESESDARLLALAPELLDCLRHTVRFFDQLSTNDIDNMRALIARATGDTK